MLFPTAVVSVVGLDGTVRASAQPVYLHTRGLDEAIQMAATGQRAHTFMSDNSGTPPAYTRGDTVTILRRLNSPHLPSIRQWTVDFVEARGDLFGPYLTIQLTAVGP